MVSIQDLGNQYYYKTAKCVCVFWFQFPNGPKKISTRYLLKLVKILTSWGNLQKKFENKGNWKGCVYFSIILSIKQIYIYFVNIAKGVTFKYYTNCVVSSILSPPLTRFQFSRKNSIGWILIFLVSDGYQKDLRQTSDR